MATHSSILAQEVPWTEEPVGYSPWDRKELDTTWRLNNNQVITWKDVHHSQGSVLPLYCRSVGKVLVSFHHHLDHSNSHYLDQWAEKDCYSLITEWTWEPQVRKEKKKKKRKSNHNQWSRIGRRRQMENSIIVK